MLQLWRYVFVGKPCNAAAVGKVAELRPGMATVTFRTPESGEQRRELTYEQSWGEILQKYRQWRCYICPDHIGEFADIAVADAWHHPVSDDQPGLSVMIARTMRGREILEQAVLEGFLEVEKVSPEILLLCRPDQAAYQGRLWARVQTLKAMRVPVPDYQRFRLFGLWVSELSVLAKIRSVLSTFKRVFVKKLHTSHTLKPCLFSQTRDVSSKV